MSKDYVLLFFFATTEYMNWFLQTVFDEFDCVFIGNGLDL